MPAISHFSREYQTRRYSVLERQSGHSSSLSGREVYDVGPPAINNASPASVAYTVLHKTGDVPNVGAPAGSRPRVDAGGSEFHFRLRPQEAPKRLESALNDSRSYPVRVQMSDGADCWVKDGKTVAASQADTRIADFTVGNLLPFVENQHHE